MDKSLFAARLALRGAQTAKDDIHRILNLRQGIGELRIVRVKDPVDVPQRPPRRCSNVVDLPLLN
ncbi:hypothetical protein D3C75_623390 [compost metagenome]